MVHGMMTLIKYALFLFNFVFWLCGLALIVPGALIQIKNSTYINFLGNSVLSAPIILIVSGCIVAILGFFGCCGAIRENYCMTMTVSKCAKLTSLQPNCAVHDSLHPGLLIATVRLVLTWQTAPPPHTYIRHIFAIKQLSAIHIFIPFLSYTMKLFPHNCCFCRCVGRLHKE
ncbi:unnamed protein product [Soboliphyme baturini]|uniref:Tetraspanin n=1 Tax=Soboliphyme baturini TaxID=241478 RepID=A0A183IET1_9BILA|nr:unnamed protein product [Soboliphyme baturini]